MRDRRVRLAFLGLILALPWGLCLRSPVGIEAEPGLPGASRAPGFEPTPMAAWVDLVLVVGLAYAARERRRLLAAPGLSDPRPGLVAGPIRLPAAAGPR